MSGSPRYRMLAAARAALAGGRLPEGDTADGFAFYHAVEALAWADDIEGAKAALDAAVDEARRRGSVFGYAAACHLRAEVNLIASRLG